MDDMPFGLARQTSYAKLSPADLESLGKQAAASYLSHAEPSLNDAIIKLAKCHPSISPHQVRRVIEFANQETFSKLFADNEKYASDKNIEFPIADPSEVLHCINDGARPQTMQPRAYEYDGAPVKTASAASAVEADLALTKLFLGVDLASPHAEKTAAQVIQHNEDGTFRVVADRILGTGEKLAGAPADRILSSGEESTRLDPSALDKGVPPAGGGEVTADEAAQVEKVAMGGPESVTMNAQPQQHPEVTHRENMRTMERRVELEKKKQELVAMQAKGMEAPGDQGGAPAPGGQAAPAAAPGAGAAEAAPAGPPMPAAPPAAGQPQKMASALTKEAMNYAKAGRPRAAQVLDDLRQATSLDTIKVAARARGGSYPDSNPHGDLVRAKQKVARLLEDARAAKDKNEFLQKEALANFQKMVVNHMYDNGNMGEVAHLMSHVQGDEVTVKVAMASVSEELQRHGFNSAHVQAQAIRYEMEKGASVRTVNPAHPIAHAYMDLYKLAEGQKVLDESHRTLQAKYDEVESVLKEAMAQNAIAV